MPIEEKKEKPKHRSVLHDNPRSHSDTRGDDQRKSAESPKREEKKDESKSTPAKGESKADAGEHKPPTEHVGKLHEKHAEEREHLHKTHETERRDMHGNHREEHRKMHARHEKSHKDMAERHMEEIAAGQSAAEGMGGASGGEPNAGPPAAAMGAAA